MARGRLLVDLAPLRRNPQFRLLWSGYLATNLGSQLTVVAVAYQTYALSHSSLDVGLVSLAQLGPLLLGALGGGAIADHVDRRLLLICTQLLLASTAVGLALNSISTRPALWPLFVCSAASAGFSGVDNPTRAALVVDLVGPGELVQANALWQVLFQTAQIAGPAVGGVLLAKVGLPAAYWSDTASYLASLACLIVLAGRRPAGSGRTAHRPFGLSAVLDGMRYLRRTKVLQAAFLIDLDAMVFGLPRAVFPALGLGHFHGGAESVGLLYSAPAVGSLAGALLTGWAATIRRQGRAVLVAVAVWGGAVTLFGLVPWLVAALGCLAVAGAADVVSAIFRATIMQLEAPPEIRGRVQALNTAVVSGGPRLGDLETGAVAALAGPIASVISGGLACVAGAAVLARTMPALGRYRAPRAAAVDDTAVER